MTLVLFSCVENHDLDTISSSQEFSEQLSNAEISLSQETGSQKWYRPANLSDHKSLSGTDSVVPSIAMDKHGNAIAVWAQTAPVNCIFKAEYHPATGWDLPTGPSDCISPAGSLLYFPKVAMDDNNNAIIVWGQTSDQGFAQVFKAEYHLATGWIVPSSNADYISVSGSSGTSPNVAMNNRGEAVITWLQTVGQVFQVFKAEYTNQTWSFPTNLADHISISTTDAFSPEVMISNGNNTTASKAVIYWVQQNSLGVLQLFKSERSGQIWVNPSSLTDNLSPDGTDASSPKGAINDSGDWIISWFQSDGLSSQIYKTQYFSSTGGLLLPTSLSDNISPDGTDAYDPTSAMDKNGHAVIVWQQFNQQNYSIYKSEFDGQAWSLPGLNDFVSFAGSDASYPSISMDKTGSAIMIWNQADGSNGQQLYKARYLKHTNSWQFPTTLSQRMSLKNKEVHAYPQVVTENGNAFVAWVQNFDKHPQIYIADYR